MKPSSSYKPTQSFGLLLVGPPGSGKTSAALLFPKPYIADCDNNLGGAARRMTAKGATFSYDTINIDDAGKEVPTDMRWERLIKCLVAATADPLIETLVVDSLTMVADYLIEDILKRANRKKMEIQDWGTLATDMKKFIIGTRAKGKAVVFIAHEKYDKDEMTGVLQFRVNFPGQLADQIGAFFSDMWRCQVVEQGGDKLPKYVIRVAPTVRISLKNSVGIDKPEFELTQDQLKEWLKK